MLLLNFLFILLTHGFPIKLGMTKSGFLISFVIQSNLNNFMRFPKCPAVKVLDFII